ncbi:MAG: methyltransferase domain-containing protein [Anaerolineaceae bacterium]|nr:methyltransferase domain-containing protein [Anaerolineaceae bacterium]
MKNNSSDRRISEINRSKTEAQQAYSRLSRWYDFVAGSSEKKYRDIGLGLLQPKSGEKILEIGCGTGEALLSLSEVDDPFPQIVGIDLSPGMLRETQKKFIRKKIDLAPQILCGDGSQIPLKSQYFDGCFMSFTLELFDTNELEKVLLECSRVMKPRGRLVVVSLDLEQGRTMGVKLYEWFHERFPRLVDCRPIYVLPLIEEAGFQVREARYFKMWGLPLAIVLAEN